MSDATHATNDDASALRLVGQVLKDGREQRELNQQQLANRLHIGVEQLVALETGRIDGLPEPVFVKAMVRRIASYLQIDPDPLVAQLQRPQGSDGPHSRDSAAEDTQASPKTQTTTTTQQHPPSAALVVANRAARSGRSLLGIKPDLATAPCGLGTTGQQCQRNRPSPSLRPSIEDSCVADQQCGTQLDHDSTQW